MSQYQINPFRFLIRLPIHYSLIDFAQTLELGEFLFKYTDGTVRAKNLPKKKFCPKWSFWRNRKNCQIQAKNLGYKTEFGAN